MRKISTAGYSLAVPEFAIQSAGASSDARSGRSRQWDPTATLSKCPNAASLILLTPQAIRVDARPKANCDGPCVRMARASDSSRACSVGTLDAGVAISRQFDATAGYTQHESGSEHPGLPVQSPKPRQSGCRKPKP